MRKWLNMYFDFSKQEYNGLLVLTLLIVTVTAIPSLYGRFWPMQDDLQAEKKAIRQLKLVMAEDAAKNEKRHDAVLIKSRLFTFNPNLIGAEQWQEMGLSVKQAAAIVKYRTKGGKFYKAEDLKKMYTISSEMYARLAPYIKITGTQDSLSGRKYTPAVYPAKQKFQPVAINTADTLELDKIRGIGPAFARRIVNYRQRLGGFYKKEQLMEVFGLDSLKFKEIKDQVIVDDLAIVKININTAGFDALKNHPYLRYKQVNAIIEFRKQHGNYSNIADLKKIVILSSETIEKLAPYISFNHD